VRVWTALGALAGGALVVGLLLRRRDMSSALAPLRAAVEPTPASTTHEWRCACGQEYRVAGAGRHRVFWLAGAPDSDPVLGTSCPRCGRELPSHDDQARLTGVQEG
jgi:hypothetical protein